MQYKNKKKVKIQFLYDHFLTDLIYCFYRRT